MTTTEPCLEELLDTKHAAPLIGLRPSTLAIWRCTERPDQPAFVKCGRAVRYRPSVLRDWVAKREHDPAKRAMT